MDSRLLATIIIFPIWLTLTLVFRRHRQWLLYYLIAAFGLTLMLVFLAEHFGIDQWLVNLASFHVSLLSKAIFHFPIELMSNGRFQLILTDGSSSILKLGIECSAILETSIVVSLVIFYPLFNPGQKILRALFGLVITYVINILRLLIIVWMAYKFGSDYIFIAHAGVARIFFFICELLLYWYLMTKPSVKSVGVSVKDGIPLGKASNVGNALQLRNAIAQMAVIVIILGLGFGSFRVSSDWQKAFVQVAKQDRPIIYQEETGMETQSSEGGQVLGQQSEIIHTAALKDIKPNQEIVYDYQMDSNGLINILMAEANSPFKLDVYINDQFVDRTIIQSILSPVIDRTLFGKAFPVNADDMVIIKITNLDQDSANFLIKFEEYK